MMFLIDMCYHGQTGWRNIDEMNASYTLNLEIYAILQFLRCICLDYLSAKSV